MAKTSGLGDNFYVGGYDLSGDVNSLSKIAGPQTTLDFTTIDKSAMVRQGALRDGGIDFVTFMDPAAGQSHAILSTLPRTDTIMTYARGTAVGNPGACLNAKQVNYDPTRGTDGSLTLSVSGVANAYGLEWGVQLTPGLRTDTVATTGAAYDNGSAGTLGGQAYFQLISFTGTSVTIDIQSSTTSGGTYATTGLTNSAFTAANKFQRVAVTSSATISEFLKVVTTGTFSNAVFNVVIVVNRTTVVF